MIYFTFFKLYSGYKYIYIYILLLLLSCVLGASSNLLDKFLIRVKELDPRGVLIYFLLFFWKKRINLRSVNIFYLTP